MVLRVGSTRCFFGYYSRSPSDMLMATYCNPVKILHQLLHDGETPHEHISGRGRLATLLGIADEQCLRVQQISRCLVYLAEGDKVMQAGPEVLQGAFFSRDSVIRIPFNMVLVRVGYQKFH